MAVQHFDTLVFHLISFLKFMFFSFHSIPFHSILILYLTQYDFTDQGKLNDAHRSFVCVFLSSVYEMLSPTIHRSRTYVILHGYYYGI